jgi:hypothetical protein
MANPAKRILRKLLQKLGLMDLDFRSFPKETISLVRQVRERNLTYLSNKKLARLLRICEIANKVETRGLFVEAGCALGGSAILLAKCKPTHAELRVFDVFGTIPAPSDRDGADVHERYKIITSGKSVGLGGSTYYGYQNDLYDRVCATFVEFGIKPNTETVSLIKGLVQDTLKIDKPVFLAHIDVDWYEPVLTCLERIVPNLCDDGFVVLDDYKDWSGCRRAVDDYFRPIRSDYRFNLSAGNLVVTKNSNSWM